MNMDPPLPIYYFYTLKYKCCTKSSPLLQHLQITTPSTIKNTRLMKHENAICLNLMQLLLGEKKPINLELSVLILDESK